jgi:hypothetical protein
MAFQNDASAGPALYYAFFEFLTHSHPGKKRIYRPHVVKPRRVCRVVKNLLGGLPGHQKYDLIFPMIGCAFGFGPSVPTFLLGEDDAHGYHAEAERERHDGVACLMTTNTLPKSVGHLDLFPFAICVKTPSDEAAFR